MNQTTFSVQGTIACDVSACVAQAFILQAIVPCAEKVVWFTRLRPIFFYKLRKLHGTPTFKTEALHQWLMKLTTKSSVTSNFKDGFISKGYKIL